MKIVYFSSASGNTRRFAFRLNGEHIPIGFRKSDETPIMQDDFILIVPTYADGSGRHAVHPLVKKFLNIKGNRDRLRGVIGTGNKNFGRFFAFAAEIISEKCHVPLLRKIEISGTEEDVEEVNRILNTYQTSTGVRDVRTNHGD